MSMRYFEIRSPRADFTGRVGGVSFADGVARVSFDDERDDDGMSVRDEHGAQVGRAAVLFAQRRRGYTATEVDAAGEPLTDKDEAKDEARVKPSGQRAGVRRDGLPVGAPKADADEAAWRKYVYDQAAKANDPGLAQWSESASRDELIAHVKEQAK